MTRAFIAMPFAQVFNPVYHYIREACEQLGIQTIRIDEVWAREDIYKQIEEEILKADFVVADFTGDRMLEVPNPNVVHEAAFARINKKYILLLAQDHKCLPFDWRTRPAIIYQQTDSGLAYLKERLVTAIQALTKKEDFGEDYQRIAVAGSNMPIPQQLPYAYPPAFTPAAVAPLPAAYMPASAALLTEASHAAIIENLLRSRQGNIISVSDKSRLRLPEGFSWQEDQPDQVYCQADASRMVYIARAKFTMGGEEDKDQQPVHETEISDYLIDIHPVTNGQYQKFIDASGYLSQGYWTQEGWCWRCQNHIEAPAFWQQSQFNQASQPVVGVSWYEAMAYAVWAKKHLPLEAQWEYAARGQDGRHFPWGQDAPSPELANYCGSGTSKFDSYPRGISPFGCYDMAGNVWEWCYDWYGEDYYRMASACNPIGPDAGREKVCRGGSWTYDSDTLKTFFRFNGATTLRDRGYGFRCARIL